MHPQTLQGLGQDPGVRKGNFRTGHLWLLDGVRDGLICCSLHRFHPKTCQVWLFQEERLDARLCPFTFVRRARLQISALPLGFWLRLRWGGSFGFWLWAENS